MEETHRSLHDAIMIVRRAMKNDAVVAGEVGVTGCLHFNNSHPCNRVVVR